MLSNERIAYFNGEFLPESSVLVSFRDRGFMMGDGVFDTARTFNHKPFRLREHVVRLFQSLKYLQIDPGLSPEEFISITEEVLERNKHLLGPDDDYWVSQRISRGSMQADMSGAGKPTVIVECTPLPLAPRAALFRDGIAVQVPMLRRTPPGSLAPQAKTQNYLNLVLGDLEAKAANPVAWAVLPDENGNLSEGMGSNFFAIKQGRLLTPEVRYVLPGITRATVLELAAGLEIPVAETGISPYDAITADEAFLTSTSLCICPASSINGQTIGDGSFPGPVTARLMKAFKELVGKDFVAQYLARLEG